MKKIFFSVCMLFALVGNAQMKTLNKEQQAVKKTVVDFYKWYKENWKNLNDFILYKGKNQQGTPPYIIDWKVAEKYFSYIRKNIPYLGEAFIKNEKEFLKECQKEFDKDPEGDVPYGFDYNRFTNSQEEPDYIVDANILNTRNNWNINIYSDKAIAFIEANYTEPIKDNWNKVELVKERGVWKIAKCLEHVDACD